MICLWCLVATQVQAATLPPVIESKALDLSAQGPVVARQPLPVASADSLAARVTHLERLLEGRALVEMLMRIEDLGKEVQQLRGQVEVQSHVLDGVKKRQRDLYLDVDRRLRQLLSATPAAPATVATGSVVTPVQDTAATVPPGSMPAGTVPQNVPTRATVNVPGTVPQADNVPAEVVDVPTMDVQERELKEQASYQQAFNVMKEGDYEATIKAFKRFLIHYPEGRYADNAQYWIGEANYFMRRFETAIQEFTTVLTAYPDSDKIPHAMLKIGYAYYELQQWQQARQGLETLLQRYPETTAAKLAKDRLYKMKLEGK